MPQHQVARLPLAKYPVEAFDLAKTSPLALDLMPSLDAAKGAQVGQQALQHQSDLVKQSILSALPACQTEYWTRDRDEAEELTQLADGRIVNLKQSTPP